MKLFKIVALFCVSIFILTSCDKVDSEKLITTNGNPAVEDVVYGDDAGVWARENFDLQAVGGILEESDNIEDFERRLNSNNGVNNLDLDGDDYADYISVREFDDRTDGSRGFSLFSQFNGDDIQEIASIIFNRDRPDRSGARVYLRGNEQIYGNNYDYEGNWLDKSLNIARFVFSDRTEPYRSPYYDDNYPDYYEPYDVVETPVYRSRVTRYTAEPVFVQLQEPQQFEIRSPYYDRSYDKTYVKFAKPSQRQLEYYKNKRDNENFSEDRKERREERRNRRENRREERTEDRRDDKRDERKDRREDRREERKDRREDQKEFEKEIKEDRKERRKERREERKENKFERKSERRDDKRSKVKFDKKQNDKPAKKFKGEGGKGGKGKGKGKKN